MRRYLKKIKTLRENPKIILIKLLYFISPILDDKIYLHLLFYVKVGYKLNLNNPQTFNEKLQWLKLYYRKDVFATMVDKYEVKRLVKELIGKDYIIPTYGIWDTFEEIDFDTLPNQFVLKTTHDQGGVVLCKDKRTFDINNSKKKIKAHQERNPFLYSREWPYKNVKPRILAEKYMEDSNFKELRDYKFFCFHGEPKLFYVATNRQSREGKVKFNYYDLDFQPINIQQVYEQNSDPISKPLNFDLMVEFAKVLSKGLPHIRVDFYEIDRKVYFGELTFFHHGGLEPFKDKAWDYKLGSYINLRYLEKN